MTPIERKGASWKAALTAQLQRVLGWIRRGVAPPPQCAPAAPDNGWPGSPRILVVDDDPSGLERARELLGRWGIAPMVAADGVQAVEFARRHEFDLILMDLQMPVLDGLWEPPSRSVCMSRRAPASARPCWPTRRMRSRTICCATVASTAFSKNPAALKRSTTACCAGAALADTLLPRLAVQPRPSPAHIRSAELAQPFGAAPVCKSMVAVFIKGLST